MNNRIKMIAISIVFACLSGCGTVGSSVNYTRGTEALEKQDYDAAIPLLEEAVRLDPTLSRNHNNLAAAYLGAGRIKDGWPHVRKAVLLDTTSEYASANFQQYWIQIVTLTGVDVGDSHATVKHNLGEPDEKDVRNRDTLWLYGSKILLFNDDKLVGTSDVPK
jgi:tetratricopeptide (TPR) repeat protein